MNRMTSMTHMLENLECDVVFTQANTKKQILLLFSPQCFLTYPSMLGNVHKLGTFIIHGKGERFR